MNKLINYLEVITNQQSNGAINLNLNKLLLKTPKQSPLLITPIMKELSKKLTIENNSGNTYVSATTNDTS